MTSSPTNTSPTGIQQLARFTNSRPEEAVIAWIESRALIA
jgi:hypothetical protein